MRIPMKRLFPRTLAVMVLMAVMAAAPSAETASLESARPFESFPR